MSELLADAHGRRFSYLRLSVTDACNFKCVYCLPHGYRRDAAEGAPLGLEEIRHLVAGFSELGTWKVRVTGGEPTMRADLFEILETVSSVSGIRRVALSTNGHRLKQNAARLKALGVAALNVSVDSLDPGRFKQATGRDCLAEVLEGIEEALRLGFDAVKVNAVLMKGEDELTPFLAWLRQRPVTVRFIELMPTAGNQAWFGRHHLRSTELLETLGRAGWSPVPRLDADGPAQELAHPDSLGRVGVIAPYSKDFCATCNRLRVSHRGELQLCLFGEGRHSLRGLLRSESQREELKSHVRALLGGKRVSHFLHDGNYGDNRTFSAIGG